MRRVVGLINLFSGIVEILVGIPFILFEIPNLLEQYKDVDVDLSYNLAGVYFYTVILIILGILNILIGLGNFDLILKSKASMVYKIGMFLVILSFVMSAWSVSRMVISIVYSLYSISKLYN